MLSPLETCTVPAVVPLDTAFAHCDISSKGSCGSRWIVRTAETLPFASTSTSWLVLTSTDVWALTWTVPSKTLIRLVWFCRTRTSYCVPRTVALTECPSTLNEAPVARCATLMNVRPTFCVTSADCRFPFFCSSTPEIFTSVLGRHADQRAVGKVDR